MNVYKLNHGPTINNLEEWQDPPREEWKVGGEYETFERAMHHKVNRPAERLVLMLIAQDCYDDFSAFINCDALAKAAGLKASKVQAVIKTLEENNILKTWADPREPTLPQKRIIKILESALPVGDARAGQ